MNSYMKKCSISCDYVDIIVVVRSFLREHLYCVLMAVVILSQTSVVTAHVIIKTKIKSFLSPSPRPRGSARRKTASSLILRGHF